MALGEKVFVEDYFLAEEDRGRGETVPGDGLGGGEAGERGAAVDLVGLSGDGTGVVDVVAALFWGREVGFLYEAEHLVVELSPKGLGAGGLGVGG